MIPEKIKIGIYLPNRNIQDVLLSNPETGNPGIGGTQFLLFSLPNYLEKYFKDKFEFIILADYDKTVKTNFEVLAVDNLEDAAQKAKNISCEMIIFRPGFDKETFAFLKKIKELKLKSIAWMHTTPRFLLNTLYRNDYVVRCVCVSHDQYETLRDHPIINKLTLIYNAVDSTYMPFKLENPKTKSVVFLGSLSFAKGFHIVAKMWKKILEYHPDAQLYVIGSGKLYNRNQKLGALGLADAKYEKMFSKYILTDSGTIHNSIKFLGVLGAEKYEIMSKASVGIGTHPDLRETFCLAAVEFQLCGTPVVSSAYGGLLDTVMDGVGGFLRNNSKSRLKSIIALLSDPDLSTRMGLAGRKIAIEKFNYEIISKDWFQLINEISSNCEVRILIIDKSNSTKLDHVREFLRIIKSKFFIFKVLMPSIYIVHTIEYIKLRIQRISFCIL